MFCSTASLLTIDGYMQGATTLVISITSIIALNDIYIPFSQAVNLP